MMRTVLDDRRFVMGGGALVAVVIVALAWFLAVSPQLAAADDFATQQADAETQNATLQARNTELGKQQERIGELKGELAGAKAGLPATTAFPELTREITASAAANDVSLDSLTISAPGPVVDAAAAAAAQTGATGSTTTTGKQRQAIVVSLTSTGTYKRQIAYLATLQQGARRMLVNSSQITTSDDARVNSVDAKTTMITQVTVFTAP